MFNPDEAVEDAWVRSGGCCEGEGTVAEGRCVPCGMNLRWDRRGMIFDGAWQAYTTGDGKLGGWEAVRQCRILCWRCYAKITAEHALPALQAFEMIPPSKRIVRQPLPRLVA